MEPQGKNPSKEMKLKKISMKELADHVGVSKMTISLYIRDPETKRISDEIKKKISDAIAQMNYSPPIKTQFKQGHKTHIIAILMPFNLPIFKYEQVNEILNGIQQTLFQQKYSFIFLHTETENGIPVLDTQTLLQCKSFDGVILFGTRYSRPDKIHFSIETLKEFRIPFVVVNMPDIKVDINQVILKNSEVCAPIDYLFSLGHKDIVFVGGYPNSLQTIQALKEYTHEHKKRNLPVRKQYILNGGFENLSAAEALEQFLRLGLPFSAIYCLSMQMTSGCYHKLKEWNLKIPEHVSIIGYGDPYYTELLEPPLSAVHLPLEDVGKRAAHLLLARVDGMEDLGNEKIFLQNSLVIRKSTAMYQP